MLISKLETTSVFKTIQILFIGLTAALLLTACGPSEKDAQQFGFANVAEMKELQAKGFKTKEEYAKSLGFDGIDEMKEAALKGFTSKYDYENDKAKKLGFENTDDMYYTNKKGFITKKDFLDAEEKAKQAGWLSLDEKLEANAKNINSPKEYKALLVEEGRKKQKGIQDEDRKKDNEVYCYMYKQALDSCATAFDTNKCLNIKLYGDAYKYQSACY